MKRLMPLALIVGGLFLAFVFLGGGGNSAQTGAGKAAGKLPKPGDLVPDDPNATMNSGFDKVESLIHSPWLPWLVGAALIVGVGIWLRNRPRIMVFALLCAVALIAAKAFA